MTDEQRPSGRPIGKAAPSAAPAGKPKPPTCTVEIINPDDVLVIGVNDCWYRSFTSSSDRYPIKVEVPAHALRPGWNLVSGAYTNIALVGKNDANVEYKVLLDSKEVVHVGYKTEVHPQCFTVNFKDSFSLSSRGLTRGTQARRKSTRYEEMMGYSEGGQGSTV
jgi:hypothetical protein